MEEYTKIALLYDLLLYDADVFTMANLTEIVHTKELFMHCSLTNKRNVLVFLLIVLCTIFNSLFAQSIVRLTGQISNAQGKPIPDVEVTEKGTTNHVLSDSTGNYAINVTNPNATIAFSLLGYHPQEVQVGENHNINITLVANDAQLSEVIVVGYGSQKRLNVTGAVVSVKGSDLQKSPAANLTNSLSGRLPGVTTRQSSGEPGYDGSSVRIRGTNSLGNSDALIVIDGVPNRSGGIDRINPSDIESISILKDASAAIYGSRAANGVILVTTKQGKTGKPRISYDYNYGWQRPTRTPQMANAVEYAKIRNELKIYDGLPSDQWSAALTAFNSAGSYTRTDNGATLTADFSPTAIQKYQDGSEPLLYPNTDWFKTTLKNWSPQQRHTFQLNGGSESVKYLLTLGYLDQDAYYRHSATGYKQYDMRFNLEAKINKYITTTFGVIARQENRNFPTVGAGDIFRMIMRGKPTEIEVWPNGLPGPDIEYGQNPYVVTTSLTGYDRDKRDYFQSNGRIEIKIPYVDGLKLTGWASIDRFNGNRKRWQIPWTLYYWDKKTYEADGVTPVLTGVVRSPATDPNLTQYSAEQLAINLTGLLNYDKKFGKHSVSFLAGVTREKVDNGSFFAYRRYFISTAIDQLSVGGQQEQNIGNNSGDPYSLYQRARLSYFGKVGYNYNEKYLFEFLWRSDGSYIFPPNKRFGFFPGATAGWRISQEKFFSDHVRFIDNLKLRGSWGQMGAEAYLPGTSTLAEYQYLATMGFGSYIINDQVARTLSESRVNNPDFGWEKANNYDIGLDGTAINNRLSFEFDYFVNKRTNILITRGGSIPESSGITDKLPPVNLGRVTNKGWEFKVGWNDYIGDDFKYSFGVNGGYSKSRIDFWDETPGAPSYQRTTGMPIGALLAYEYDGVFVDQQAVSSNTIDYSAITANLRPGDMKLKDVNNDGKITGDDMVRLDKTNTPRFSGGITLNCEYKGIDLSVLFQGATGGLQSLGLTESGDIGNFTQYAIDHSWKIESPSSTDPRLANRNNTYYTDGTIAGNNTYWLKNSNYLRLKNIELGYSLPDKFLRKIGASRVRIFVNALNLLTWDKLKIWDPESTSSNGQYYPQAKVINTGISVMF